MNFEPTYWKCLSLARHTSISIIPIQRAKAYKEFSIGPCFGNAHTQFFFLFVWKGSIPSGILSMVWSCMEFIVRKGIFDFGESFNFNFLIKRYFVHYFHDVTTILKLQIIFTLLKTPRYRWDLNWGPSAQDSPRLNYCATMCWDDGVIR